MRVYGDKIMVGSRSISELRSRFVGQYVRTERELTIAEAPEWLGPLVYCPQMPPYNFGGEGVVASFDMWHDKITVEMDWGFAWRIDPLTTIQLVTYAVR